MAKNNYFFNLLISTAFLLGSCSYKTKPGIVHPEHVWSYQELISNYKECRGKGRLISRGQINGQLTFSFTSHNDSTFIQFKDMLGRRTLFMQLFENEVFAWDMLQNKQFSKDQILVRFPFIKIVNPQDLTRFLWGVDPKINTNRLNQINTDDWNSIKLSFQSLPDSSVPLINQAEFKLWNNNKIEIEIVEREFGMSYSYLIHAIPSSIPLY